MSNHSYMISQSILHKLRDQKGTRRLVEGTGLNIENDLGFIVPTASTLESGMSDFGLKLQLKKYGEHHYEFNAIDSKQRQIWIEFNSKSSKQELILIEIRSGSDHDLVYELFRHLGKIYGIFLYYSTSGLASAITYEKSNAQISNEMGIIGLEK